MWRKLTPVHRSSFFFKTSGEKTGGVRVGMTPLWYKSVVGVGGEALVFIANKSAQSSALFSCNQKTCPETCQLYSSIFAAVFSILKFLFSGNTFLSYVSWWDRKMVTLRQDDRWRCPNITGICSCRSTGVRYTVFPICLFYFVSNFAYFHTAMYYKD